jgi:hypothetical protein
MRARGSRARWTACFLAGVWTTLHPKTTRAEPPPQPAPAPEWFQSVYQKARTSVVRVESAHGHGTGFFFHSPRHIATALHVVDVGRSITVRLFDKRSFEAVVVATDAKADLAILEIVDGQPNGTPLLPSTEKPDFGTPILIIGHPAASREVLEARKGLLEWNPGRGIVTRLGEEWLQVDVVVNGGDSGGPVLDREGRVLGVISNSLGSLRFAVPVARLEQLAPKIRRQGTFRGKWAFEGTFGLMTHVNTREVWLGPELGVGAVLFDRWTAGATLGLLWPVDEPDPPAPIVSRSRFRVIGELDLGYRFLLLEESPYQFYMRLTGGVAISSEDVNETSAAIVQSRLRITHTSTETPKGRPMLSASFFKGPTFLGYAVLFDVDHVQSTLHQVTVGAHY